MKLKEKFKSYKFWVALTSAVIIFLQTLGKELGFSISEETISNIVITFCGILVLLGFINDDRNTPTTPQITTEEQVEINNKQENSDAQIAEKKEA